LLAPFIKIALTDLGPDNQPSSDLATARAPSPIGWPFCPVRRFRLRRKRWCWC